MEDQGPQPFHWVSQQPVVHEASTLRADHVATRGAILQKGPLKTQKIIDTILEYQAWRLRGYMGDEGRERLRVGAVGKRSALKLTLQ